ncbi:S-adenosylmethionine decarboxylase [Thermosporothrix hazakensis]|jgi:S-adenosylmethionine decarboxylase proenzyme|uniref:S-adenosylmethionine decarboxylase n=2 Tax=Thermosporothrix TaxID=768650 RepID=A0A326TZV1_THEHA|nr:adenosylmethionine decarboxylase [Thermosporothrix hazakensis]PZW22428.1 S-adenosylmethionine decarboxylase [Thermosporothrix hazakensis]BBH86089.1 S-adenosylmethionine decarboxylase proenzyme [Thermosporothrix sp. COM3]GCE45486.1 S-adenosylmethionine decarboxylase proenzyme [Thermosporothrix hazakensis]
MTTPPVGLHILSELYDCERVGKIDKQTLSEKVAQLVRENQLTQIGALYHEFEGGGITAVIPLAESHIALHTWPELAYVTLEVYVCNYTRDNSNAARNVHQAIAELFAPGRMQTHELTR